MTDPTTTTIDIASETTTMNPNYIANTTQVMDLKNETTLVDLNKTIERERYINELVSKLPPRGYNKNLRPHEGCEKEAS